MILSKVVGPAVEAPEHSLDPFAKEEASEAAENRNTRRKPLSREQQVAAILGAVTWQRRVTFLDPTKRIAATFWLVFERPRVVCDVLPKNAKREDFEWRGEIARREGYRWIAFQEGANVDMDDIRRQAGKE